MSEEEIPWEYLTIGVCYKSSFDYLKRAGMKTPPEDEYLGMLKTAPEKEFKNSGLGGSATSSYYVWSADFLNNGIESKRYQTGDPNNKQMLGFFFKSVSCRDSKMIGGKRNHKQKTRKHRRNRRYSRKK